MTTKTTYNVFVGREKAPRLTFRARLEEASAPITIVDEDGVEHSTPWQTADARHDERGAAELLRGRGDDAIWEEGDSIRIVEE